MTANRNEPEPGRPPSGQSEPIGDPRSLESDDPQHAPPHPTAQAANYRDALALIPRDDDDPAVEMFRLTYPQLLKDGTYPDPSMAWDTSVGAVQKKYPDFEPDPSWRTV